MLRRWTFRRFHFEVDDRKPTSRVQRLSQPVEVCDAIVDVVIGINDQNQVNRFWDIGRFFISYNRYYRAQVFTARTLAEVAQHLRFDVDSEHFAFWQALGNSHTEIPCAGSEIGNAGCRGKIQRI